MSRPALVLLVLCLQLAGCGSFSETWSDGWKRPPDKNLVVGFASCEKIRSSTCGSIAHRTIFSGGIAHYFDEQGYSYTWVGKEIRKSRWLIERRKGDLGDWEAWRLESMPKWMGGVRIEKIPGHPELGPEIVPGDVFALKELFENGQRRMPVATPDGDSANLDELLQKLKSSNSGRAR